LLFSWVLQKKLEQITFNATDGGAGCFIAINRRPETEVTKKRCGVKSVLFQYQTPQIDQ